MGLLILLLLVIVNNYKNDNINSFLGEICSSELLVVGVGFVMSVCDDFINLEIWFEKEVFILYLFFRCVVILVFFSGFFWGGIYF